LQQRRAPSHSARRRSFPTPKIAKNVQKTVDSFPKLMFFEQFWKAIKIFLANDQEQEVKYPQHSCLIFFKGEGVIFGENVWGDGEVFVFL